MGALTTTSATTTKTTTQISPETDRASPSPSDPGAAVPADTLAAALTDAGAAALIDAAGDPGVMPAGAMSGGGDEDGATHDNLADAVAAAETAGLRYVNDHEPGIRRRRAGKGFSYTGPDGSLVRDPATLRRIRALAVPPAWTEVWICATDDGHIQAVGRDARGRKQYRYHARWREVRDQAKFDRTLAFARALPRIRARVAEDLARPGLPREKVLATVVRLLETTLIRVGNDEYAKQNKSYGLTTMLDQHVKVEGTKVNFVFKGKSGIRHRLTIADRRVSRIIKKSQELRGQQLFQYLDEDGNVCDVDSGDVNDYLKEISGEDFTAKDFRTWAATVLAARALRAIEAWETKTAARKNVVEAIKKVAQDLGNTPSVARKSYVHPAIIDAYLEGSTLEALRQQAEDDFLSDDALDPEEAAVLDFLQSRAAAAGGNEQTLEEALEHSIEIAQRRKGGREAGADGSAAAVGADPA